MKKHRESEEYLARQDVLKAERAWEVELRSVYGVDAFKQRLLAGRNGEPGSNLRAAYLAYMTAVRRWDNVAPTGMMVPSIYRPEKAKKRPVVRRYSNRVRQPNKGTAD